MTDFDAGRGRRIHPDEDYDRDRGSRVAPAPRTTEYDRIPAYAMAQAARQRRASRRLDEAPTGPVPHISGPLPDLPWWSPAGDAEESATRVPQSRHRGGSDDHPGDVPPSGTPPVPPRPAGAWSRLQGHNSQTPSGNAPGAGYGGRGRHGGGHPLDHPLDEDSTDAHPLDPAGWDDRTGGLEVIGAHVEDERPRRARRRRRPAVVESEVEHQQRRAHDDEHDDEHPDERHMVLHDELLGDDGHDGPLLSDEDIPLKPFDRRRVRARRRRRRVAGVVALVVLTGLVLGIVFGGSKLLGMINPSSRDYAGAGHGSVSIRVHDGDTLSDIARSLVQADVIAGTGHFVSAAKANPAATGIAPGVYSMRLHMSGSQALDRLLDPASRLLSRVTIPEGLTAAATLKRLSDQTHIALADLQAAAKNPAQLGLPAYANGSLEGFLFPATYDFEPHTTAVDMLKAMVSRGIQAMDSLQIPVDQRLTVLTKASIVQAESGSVADMGKVAQVLDNRLKANMNLQLDTTVNYATGKTGLTTSDEDRANPSPYNTYVHAGLPPGPISNPGEEALKAVLSPTPGPWMFFVVVNPDTGETRFATTQQEHEQNVALFQQWLRAHPNG